jgi:hypothetical protein
MLVELLEAIALQSQDWPRMMTTCLLYGCQTKKEQIDEEIVGMAAKEHLY